MIYQGRGGQDVVNPPAKPPFHGLGHSVVEKGVLSGFSGVVFPEYIHQPHDLTKS